MRNIWIAILGVISITFFAGTAMALAPVAQDLPDFKILTGPEGNTVDDFTLDEYVTDYDDAPSSLDWTIEGNSGFTSVPTNSIDTGNLLNIGGSSTVQQGTFELKVCDDTPECDTVDTVVKFSSLMITGPSLTQDNNLAVGITVPRTVVVQADQDSTTADLRDLITPTSAVPDTNLTVSIADMSGAWKAGDNETSATYEDLEASVNGSGQLVLSAAATYPEGGLFSELSGVYRVGVKAKMTGGGAANWDGMELLVSQSRYPVRYNPNNWANLNAFNNFEGLTLGNLPVGNGALAKVWGTQIAAGGATAKIVDIATAMPGAPAWAASGQALELAVTADTDAVFISSEFFTDIRPGETLTFAANVTSNAGPTAKVGTLTMFMGNLHIASNDSGMVLQSGTGGANEMPVNGNWRRVKTTFVADTVGANVNGVNFYARGYQCFFVLAGLSGVTYPYTVYIDNVRVYRDEADIDKALGSTVTHPSLLVGGNPSTTAYDGTFEGATAQTLTTTSDVTGQNWAVNGAAAAGTAAIVDDSLNNGPSQAGTKALQLYVPGVGRTVSQAEFVYTKVSLDGSLAGKLDYSGEGLYALTGWFKTDAPDVKSLPGVLVALTDPQFSNVAFADCGYPAAPMAGAGWKQVAVTQARTTGSKLWPFIVVQAERLWNDPGAPAGTLKAYWAPYNVLGDNPGYEGDGKVYFDDVQVQKVMDEAKYFDRSVFPATD